MKECHLHLSMVNRMVSEYVPEELLQYAASDFVVREMLSFLIVSGSTLVEDVFEHTRRHSRRPNSSKLEEPWVLGELMGRGVIKADINFAAIFIDPFIMLRVAAMENYNDRRGRLIHEEPCKEPVQSRGDARQEHETS